MDVAPELSRLRKEPKLEDSMECIGGPVTSDKSLALGLAPPPHHFHQCPLNCVCSELDQAVQGSRAEARHPTVACLCFSGGFIPHLTQSVLQATELAHLK